MTDKSRDRGLEKKGGYSGSKPASSMGPPARVPSGSLTPPRPKPEKR